MLRMWRQYLRVARQAHMVESARTAFGNGYVAATYAGRAILCFALRFAVFGETCAAIVIADCGVDCRKTEATEKERP